MSSTAVVIGQAMAAGHLFNEQVGEKLLFQPGSYGDERRHPGKLVGLGLVGAVEAIADEAVLAVQGGEEQREKAGARNKIFALSLSKSKTLVNKKW